MVHNIDCSGHTGKYAMKEGFSLVEVIIAVALLAFMALPILAYFTNAAVTTSRGKNSQKAAMAAESVLEELNSFDTLEQMEEYLKAESAADPGWSITQAESVTGEAGKTTATTLTRRDIEVDGTTYNAKVTLEYNYPSVSGGYTNPNLQELPELKEVYSSENAVIAEEDQLDRAVSHYLMKYPDQSKVDIINKLNRKLCLDITEKEDIFTVTGSYHYTYNGSESDSYDAVVARTKVKDPANVYFFYKRTNYEQGGTSIVVNEEEQVSVSAAPVSGNAADQIAFDAVMDKMHIYFICQKEGTEDKIHIAHRLKFELLLRASRAVYHTNLDSANVVGIATDHRQELVTSSTKKRIAKVVVDVYGKEDLSMSESLAHLESSKGE